ncbi:MAG: glycosyltransferase [Lentisphaeria bacterium]|nr:glycosyltransferase [Lentisphaeria bacterium]
MILLSFVIPCYGSEKTIESVYKEISSKVAEKPEYDYEIIAVNDCSPDGVLSVLYHLNAQNNKFKVINLARNMNRLGAVMAGLNSTSGDIVIVMDDDGQCPVERLWDLLEPLDHGFDVSIAKYPQHKQTLFKHFGTWVNKKMTEIVLKRPPDLEFTNFTAMKKYIAREIIQYPNPYPYMTGLLLRTTKYITNVVMEERERFSGKTTFTFRKMFSMWINGLTAFSVLPLRIATFLGFVVSTTGFLLGLIFIIRKLIRPDIAAGYSSIIVSIFILDGIVLLILGMVGEYIGRIYICLNKSPQYVIKDKVGFEDREKEK